MSNRRERGVITNSMASKDLKIDEETYISLYQHDIAFADKKTFAKRRVEYLEALQKIREAKKEKN